MCQYEYHHYSECSHRVIKLAAICAPKLWSAGMTGNLLPCHEVWYTSVVVGGLDWSVGRWKWVGAKGFCGICRSILMINASPIIQPSYNDEIFTRSSLLSGWWMEPFIHLPHLTKNIPELTGVAHQFRVSFPDSPMDEGPDMTFREKFEVYIRDLPKNRTQWLRHCNTGAVPGPLWIQGDIYRMMGFTSVDIGKVGKAIGRGWKGGDIYEAEFKKRGMPRGVFDFFAGKIYTEYKLLTNRKGKRFVDKWNMA